MGGTVNPLVGRFESYPRSRRILRSCQGFLLFEWCRRAMDLGRWRRSSDVSALVPRSEPIGSVAGMVFCVGASPQSSTTRPEAAAGWWVADGTDRLEDEKEATRLAEGGPACTGLGQCLPRLSEPVASEAACVIRQSAPTGACELGPPRAGHSRPVERIGHVHGIETAQLDDCAPSTRRGDLDNGVERA